MRSLETDENADDDVFNEYKEIAIGEISEGLSGSENMACMERSIRNLGSQISCRFQQISW